MNTTFMSNTKNMMSKSTGIASTLLISGMLFPSIAFAYVDPGSGSVIVTTILGFIAAVGYTFRKYFYKAKRAIRGKDTKDESNENKDET